MTNQLNRYFDVEDMPEEYDLLGEDDFLHFCESVGVEPGEYRAGFALIGYGEVLELWAFPGIVPDLDKWVECLYDVRIHDEVRHLYWGVGEYNKTRRYPKNAKTFERRMLDWLHSISHLSPDNVVERTVCGAFNVGWLKTSALEWHGIDRNSRWLTR